MTGSGLLPAIGEQVRMTIVGASALGGRVSADVIPLARAPPATTTANLSVEEWDDLFGAVRERLAVNVAALFETSCTEDAVALARTSLQECVGALGQLKTLREPERDHCRRLELQVADLRTALAMAISELVELPRPALVAGLPTEVIHGV